ncbi:hypothetical protein FCJ60_08225 [Burkholderia metallica]|nr:hypothetical protein [Burkholderia metallica]
MHGRAAPARWYRFRRSSGSDLADRIKDMFIVDGFNCHPAEIERLFAAHPAIGQVARVGVHIDRRRDAARRGGRAFAPARDVLEGRRRVVHPVARVALLPGLFVREGQGVCAAVEVRAGDRRSGRDRLGARIICLSTFASVRRRRTT